MIRYAVPWAELVSAVDAEAPGWRARAQARTTAFAQLGRYEEASPIWSEVKPVLVRVQGGGKCAYCERLLESEAYGLVEHDLEHFRPKGSVKTWKIPAELVDAGISATSVPPSAGGYPLLAYHLGNYAVSCKACNATLKGDRFPIAGTYDLLGTDPAILNATERPLLLFPLGEVGDDAELYIGFNGDQPYARHAPGTDEHARARVTIAFFRLADPRRTNLRRERARILVALYTALAFLADAPPGGPDRPIAQAAVDDALRSDSAHSSCARCFASMFNQDRDIARAFAKAAADWLASKSG